MARVRAWIAAQGVAPGLRLPPIRPFARELALDRNSVYRAICTLIDSGALRRRERLLSLPLEITAPTPVSARPARVVALLVHRGIRSGIATDSMIFTNHTIAVLRTRLNHSGLLPTLWEVDLPELLRSGLPFGTAAVVNLFDSLAGQQHLRMTRLAIEAGLPVVLAEDSLPVGRTPYDALPCDRVGFDQAQGRETLFRWLHARGRAHLLPLLALAPTRTAPNWLHQQLAGMRRACVSLGIPALAPVILPRVTDAVWYGTEDLHARVIAGALLGRLGETPELCAVIAPTDGLVPPLARALRLLGPDLLSRVLVAGYDGYYWTDAKMLDWRRRCGFEPAVSVALPGLALGETLAELVISRLDRSYAGPPRRVLVPMPLVVPPLDDPLTPKRHRRLR